MPADTDQLTQRGLTLRSFFVAILAMFLMGVWIEYEEVYNFNGGPLAENSPPNSAVGVICVLLVIGGGLYKFRKSLRLVTAELVVIYAALLLSAPLMTQGLWHRLFGLLAAIPHNQDFKSYESLPPMLWPHGENLIVNGRFERELDGCTTTGQVTWGSVEWKARQWKVPVLTGPAALSVTLNRRDATGREVLVPGESFLFSALVKATGLTKGSAYQISLQADDGPLTPLTVNTEDTRPTFSLPGGLRRIGVSPVTIPSGLKDRLTFKFELIGGGTLALMDLEFFSNEAIESAYSGRKLVRASNLATLDANERDSTAVRPDNLASWAGLKYLVTGNIPLDQWARPAVAWSLLIGALFIGLLGLNVLMRKQWVDNERFTFPLTTLPKQLFGEENGRLKIVRNRVMWIGFAVTLPLVILKGLNFYNPSVPAPVWGTDSFAAYVNDPLAKAFLGNVGIGTGSLVGFSFSLLAIALLIETDILFSLWASFLLFQLWHVGGKAFNWTSTQPGYPWVFQQATGAFLAFAALAVFVGRHHLAKVARIILGWEKSDEGNGEIVSYRTAALLVVGSLVIIVAWSIWTKMGVLAGVLFFGYILLCGFAASKIRAECGAPLGSLTPYYGMQFVAALGGFAVFQSTGMLVATIASGFMCTTVFLLFAPVQVEMMELGRYFRVRPKDIGAGLTLGLLGGLFIGGFVMLCWTYNIGSNNLRTIYPYQQNYYFNTDFRGGEQAADRLVASGKFTVPPESAPLNFSKNINAKGMGIGATITVALAALRAKFMWFPFHPIGYVLSSSFFMRAVWFTLFVAWIIRWLMFRLGGAQTIRRGLVPLCVGMFLACVASVIIFDVVGIYLRYQGVVSIYSKIP